MLNISINFINKIKRNLFPFYKDKELKFVFDKIQEGSSADNVTARFVGGCVRKYLSNNKIDDIDIATALNAEEIKEKFKNTKFNVIDSGIKHGTVTLVYKKLKLELTTLRKDVETDGRHAKIQYTDNWIEDSNRRDFTINAIYLDINGKIFDPQLGINDLKKNVVKFIGNPQKRIEEDYLRIVRYIRFCLEYESEIEQKTIEAIKLNLNGIKRISKERILIELFKILRAKKFTKLNEFQYLREIFSLIFPELRYFERLEKLDTISTQNDFDIKTLVAVLLIDETNNHEYFSHKYNVSNNIKDYLHLLAKNYIISKDDRNFFDKDLKKNVYYFGKEHLKVLNILNFTNRKKFKLEDYMEKLSIIRKTSLPKFPFDGNYLKKRGVKEGEVIGRILKLLELEWLDNNFKISNQRISNIIDEQIS